MGKAAVLAFDAFGKAGVRYASEVAAMLKDEDAVVRRSTCLALGSMGKGAQKQAYAIIAVLVSEEDSEVRRTGLDALTKMGVHPSGEQMASASIVAVKAVVKIIAASAHL